jgi:para-nitrobenzyl esterase
LDSGSIGRIQELAVEEVLRATANVMQQQAAKPQDKRLGFGPVLDGVTVLAHPFDPQASDLSAGVPMIVGSTLNEFTSATNHPDLAAMSEAELEKRVRDVHGEQTQAILKVFLDTMPKSTPFERWSAICCVPNRDGAIRQCQAKAALGNAPAFLYWFTWKTPLLDERPGAFHCAEIPFVFDNTDRCDTMTGGGARPRVLAARMSESWIRFAKTGNPNHAGLPQWLPFDAHSIPTMIFDDRIRLEMDPDGAQRRVVLRA